MAETTKKRGRPSGKKSAPDNDPSTATTIDIPDGLSHDAPPTDFSPLEDPTKERTYTGGDPSGNGQATAPVSEEPIPEPQYKAPLPNADQVGSNFFSEQQKTAQNPNDIGGGFGQQQQTQATPPPSQEKPPEAPNNLQDLSPAEKRKAVEQTADMFLQAYGNYSHVPFVWMGSFDMKKLRKLEKDGEIDLNEELRRDGTTIEEYAIDHNNTIEKALKTSDETLANIRDPLIDVLMEQNIALTPTQRLIFALGQDLVAKTVIGFRMMREVKSSIEEMKEMHAEKMEKAEKVSGSSKATSAEVPFEDAPPAPSNDTAKKPEPEKNRKPTLDEVLAGETKPPVEDKHDDEEEQDIPDSSFSASKDEEDGIPTIPTEPVN